MNRDYRIVTPPAAFMQRLNTIFDIIKVEKSNSVDHAVQKTAAKEAPKSPLDTINSAMLQAARQSLLNNVRPEPAAGSKRRRSDSFKSSHQDHIIPGRRKKRLDRSAARQGR